MGYVSLECSYTVGRKKEGYHTSRPTKDGEDYIATEVADILKENPTAKNIVVVEPPFNEGYPYALDGLIDLILERRPDLDRKKLEDNHWRILSTDRDDYRRGAYIVPLAEAKAIFDDEDSDYRDWVYFKDFGIVIFDVTKHTSHEIFLAHWYHILSRVLPSKLDLESYLDKVEGGRKGIEDDAEKFLHAKHGFFLSGAFQLYLVNKSSDYKLNAQEKAIFAKSRFRDIDPD